MDELIDVGLLMEARTQGVNLLEHLGSVLGGLAVGATAVAAAFGAVSAFAIHAGEQVLNQAVSVEKLSNDYGVSKKSIQEWHGMMLLAGDSTGAVDTAMQRLSMRIGMIHNQFLATGKVAPALVEPFKQLGLSAKDLESSAPDVILGKMLEGLAKIPNATDRAFVGVRTLGGGWKDLFDMYEKSGGNLDAFRAKVEASGYVLADQAVKDAQAAAMAQHELGLEFQGVTNVVGIAMIPVFNKLSIFIQDMMPYIKNLADFLAAKVIPAFLTWAEHVLPLLIVEAKKFSNWLQDIAIPNLHKMWDAIQPLIDAGKKLVESFFGQFSQASGATGMLDSFTNIIKTLAPIVKDFIDYLASHPKIMDLLLGAMAAKSLLPGLGAGGAVGGAVGLGVAGAATAAGAPPGVAAAAGIAAGLGSAVATNALGNAVGNLASGAAQAVGKGMATMLGKMLSPLLTPVFAAAGTVAGTVFGGALELAVLFAIPLLVVAAGVALGVLGYYIITFLIPQWRGAILGWIQDMAVKLLQWNRDTSAKLAAFLQSIVANIKTWLREEMDIIRTNLLSAIGWAGQIGVGIANGIMHGIGSLKDKIINWAKKDLPDWIKGPLGIRSPSKLFADEVGLPIAHGIAVGISGGAHAIKTAVSGITKGFGAGSTSGAGAGGSSTDMATLMQELIDELKAHRGILQSIAAKDLGPAVNKVVTTRLTAARA